MEHQETVARDAGDGQPEGKSISRCSEIKPPLPQGEGWVRASGLSTAGQCETCRDRGWAYCCGTAMRPRLRACPARRVIGSSEGEAPLPQAGTVSDRRVAAPPRATAPDLMQTFEVLRESALTAPEGSNSRGTRTRAGTMRNERDVQFDTESGAWFGKSMPISPEEMAGRVWRFGELVPSPRAFLDFTPPVRVRILFSALGPGRKRPSSPSPVVRRSTGATIAKIDSPRALRRHPRTVPRPLRIPQRGRVRITPPHHPRRPQCRPQHLDKALRVCLRQGCRISETDCVTSAIFCPCAELLRPLEMTLFV